MPIFAEAGNRLVIDPDPASPEVFGPVATMPEEWQKFFADPDAYLAKVIAAGTHKLKVQAAGAANGIIWMDLRLTM